MVSKEAIREKVGRFAHLLTGFLIVIKGVTKIEHHQNGLGAFLILIGIVFGLIALLHEKLPWIKRHEAFLLWTEAFVLAIVTYSYFSEGKTALPIVYALCTVAYVIVGFYRYHQPQAAHH